MEEFHMDRARINQLRRDGTLPLLIYGYDLATHRFGELARSLQDNLRAVIVERDQATQALATLIKAVEDSALGIQCLHTIDCQVAKSGVCECGASKITARVYEIIEATHAR